MNNGMTYKKNPDRCEFDITLHFTAYKEEKTLIDITAPNPIADDDALTKDIISAVLTAMAKHGIGEGVKNLRKVEDNGKEDVGA